MAIEITPEPSDGERRAILAALDVSEPQTPSRWRASALEDLRDGALAEQSGGDAGIVEP